MELILYGILTFLSVASARVVDTLPKPLGKQLFLSRNVVTEAGEFDGGVLVDEEGIIEAVLKRDVVNTLLSQGLHDLQIIDGGEVALMAGVVDSHVHVNEPGRSSWEGYVTATRAAAVGGITTVIDMPLNSIPPTTTLENLRIKAAMAREEIFVDVGFWGGVIPGNEKHLRDLIAAGVVGFKCFLTDSGVQEFPNVSPNDLAQVFEVLNGTGTVLAFHAEVSLNTTDKPCSRDCPNPLLYDTYMATHPEEMEWKAVSLITSFLPQTDVHVHVVHVSSEGVVPILEAAREKRVKAGYAGWRGGVSAETCHHYLTFSSEYIPPGRSEFKCSPPIRNNTNKQKLWEYIKDGRLDLVASDHSPSVEDLKGTDFLKAWGGISSLQFGLSLFWTEANARGFGLSTASHYLSAGPARLAGLQHRKGALRPGLDADLIFFDPNASFVVTPEVIRYKNKISPYMNRVLTGLVVRTYLRGELIHAYGDLMGQPRGQLLLNDETIKKQPRIAETHTKSRKNGAQVAYLDTVDNNERNITQGESTVTTKVLDDASSPVAGARKISQVNLYQRNEYVTNLENTLNQSKVELNNTNLLLDNVTSIENSTTKSLITSADSMTTTHYEKHSQGNTMDDSSMNKTSVNKLEDSSMNTSFSVNDDDKNVTMMTEAPTALGAVKEWVRGLVGRGASCTGNADNHMLIAVITIVLITYYT